MAPLTEDEKYGILEPRLHIGFDQVLKYTYRKGKATHTKKIVRVCDGIVTVLDPATKTQTVVGKAMWVGDTLVIAMTVRKE